MQVKDCMVRPGLQLVGQGRKSKRIQDSGRPEAALEQEIDLAYLLHCLRPSPRIRYCHRLELETRKLMLSEQRLQAMPQDHPGMDHRTLGNTARPLCGARPSSNRLMRRWAISLRATGPSTKQLTSKRCPKGTKGVSNSKPTSRSNKI